MLQQAHHQRDGGGPSGYDAAEEQEDRAASFRSRQYPLASQLPANFSTTRGGNTLLEREEASAGPSAEPRGLAAPRIATAVDPAELSCSDSCGSCVGNPSASEDLEASSQELQASHREGKGEWEVLSGISGSDDNMKTDANQDSQRRTKRRHDISRQQQGLLLTGNGPGSIQAGTLEEWPLVEGRGEFDVQNGVGQVFPRCRQHGTSSSGRGAVPPRRASSHTGPVREDRAGSSGGSSRQAIKARRVGLSLARRGRSAEPSEEEQANTPIHRLSEDLLVGIFQKLSTSEWRTIVPSVCRRWNHIVRTCDDVWGHLEVCPFENSEVTRRLVPYAVEDRYWPMDAMQQIWLASSSLSSSHVMRSILPHAAHVRALLISCLSLTLTPASTPAEDGGAIEEDLSRLPRVVRASDITDGDLVQLIHAMGPSLRQFMIRVSGQITTPRVIAEACKVPSLEVLHAELGNIDLDCSMMAPLKCLTSLRLRRDELSLSLDSSNMRLLNLHRLAECTELMRLSLGLDTHLEQLPLQIFALDKLRILEVDRCSSLDRIPSCVSQLTSLETLSLSGSSSLHSLPPEMKSLAQLVSLNLDFCTQMASLPPAIGNLSNLRVLSMEGGYAIFDDGVPCEIGLCSSLQSLVLADTHILSLPKLGKKLASCMNLRVLYLDHNDDLQVESYPKEIMALPKLDTLSLRKYERQSWSAVSTRNIARMQEEATQLRLQHGRHLQIIL